MRQLKTATAELEALLNERLATIRTQSLSMIESKLAELVASADYVRAPADAKEQVVSQIDTWKQHVNVENEIALVKHHAANFEDTVYPGLVDLIFRSQPEVQIDLDVRRDDPGDAPVRSTVSIRSIKVRSSTTILQTEDDIDAYLNAYRAELIKAIRSGKRVTL